MEERVILLEKIIHLGESLLSLKNFSRFFSFILGFVLVLVLVLVNIYLCVLFIYLFFLVVCL